ncbi:MAG: hypothetical protein ACREP2_10650 [Rhodanobacteraceae bacterium]
MIESIAIDDIPPFDGAVPASIKPGKLNYFFGTNGVGKTTISRVIANAGAFPTCTGCDS